mmetsp:Transcript_3410/g.5047  ORF Transcript_3410/g.5047 Transcript_3410/m.5047 type:complete len:255 (-) Transcript_3410:127-891(-)
MSSGRQSAGCDCRLLPHGAYILIPAVLSTAAWIGSLLQDGCDYASLHGNNAALLSGDSTTPFAEVGLSAYRLPVYNQESNTWTEPLRGACLMYPPSIPIDGTWKFAKGCAFFALVFGGGGALFLWFSSCFVFGPGTWRWAGYEVLIASILQTLAFTFFNTAMCKTNDSHCSLFIGSKLDIMASVFWFASAMSIFLKYPNPTPKVSFGASTSRAHRQGGDEGGATGGGLSSDVTLPVENAIPVENEIPASSLEII